MLEQAQTTSGKIFAAGTRQYKGLAGRFLWWLDVLFGTYVVLTMAGIFQMLGLFILSLRYDAIFLMYVLVLTYIYNPMTKNSPRDRLPWYDAIAILLGIICTGYIAIMAAELPERPSAEITTLEVVLGSICVLLVLEGVRRTVGTVLTVLGVLFLIYPFISNHLPAFLECSPSSLDEVIRLLYVFPYGLFGPLLHIFSSTVAPFLVFGSFLLRSGAGDFFISLATGLAGHFRGGPAKIAVIASGLFGSISGSPMANVTTTGSITIPMMKKLGYPSHFAGAVEAVASQGGQIMPPVLGAAAFIMMDFLGVSYLTIIKAAIIPALLYYTALFLMLDQEAVKRGLKGLPREELPSVKGVLANGWPYAIPVVVLLVLIGPLKFSPQTACVWSIAAVVGCSWLMKGRGMRPRQIGDGLGSGMRLLPNVCIIMEVAAILVGISELTGLGLRITGGLISLAAGNMLLLALLAAFSGIFLGMGLPSSGVYLMTAILVAPALIQAGVAPIVAHFYCWYYGLSAALTPPVCIVSFVAARIAEAPYMKTGVQGARLGVVIFIVPIMFFFGPELLLMGAPGDVALAVVTAFIGVFFLSTGIGGYFFRPTNWLIRIPLLISGVMLMYPGLPTDLIGISLGFIATLWQWNVSKRSIG